MQVHIMSCFCLLKFLTDEKATRDLSHIIIVVKRKIYIIIVSDVYYTNPVTLQMTISYELVIESLLNSEKLLLPVN